MATKAKKSTKTTSRAELRRQAVKAGTIPAKKAKKANGTPRAEGKMAKVRALMARASGCTRAQILELTGWRAVSPQQIAEKAGLKIKIKKVEGKPTVYRA